MHRVSDKDSIEIEVIPCISKTKRSFALTVRLTGVVNTTAHNKYKPGSKIHHFSFEQI